MIARFGLMHVVATNICVWIRTLVLEYLKEITSYHKRLNNTEQAGKFFAGKGDMVLWLLVAFVYSLLAGVNINQSICVHKIDVLFVSQIVNGAKSFAPSLTVHIQ